MKKGKAYELYLAVFNTAGTETRDYFLLAAGTIPTNHSQEV